MVLGMGGDNSVEVAVESSGVGGFVGDMDSAQAALAGIEGKAFAAGTAIAAISGKALKDSVGAAMSFDAQMTESLAVIGDVSDAMRDDMSQAARDVAKETRFSAEESAEAYYFLASAGLDAKQSIEALPQVSSFAAAGALDMADASDYATDIMKAFGYEAEDLNKVTDTLTATFTNHNQTAAGMGEAMSYVAPVAASMGMSIEDASAAIGMMGDAGIKGSRAGTTLRQALAKLASPAEKQAELLNELGVETKDSSGELRSMSDILRDLEAAGVTSGQMMELFGTRAGPGMQVLLNEGGDALDDYSDKIAASGGITEEVAEKQLDTAIARWDIFKSTIRDVGISIGTVFLPIISTMLDALTKAVNVFGRVNDALGGLPGAITLVTGLIGGLTTAFMAIQGTALTAAVPSIAAIGSTLMAVLGPIALVGAAIGGMVAIWTTDFAQIRTRTENALGAIRDRISSFGAAILAIIQPRLANLRSIWENEWNILNALAERTLDGIIMRVGTGLSALTGMFGVSTSDILAVVETWADRMTMRIGGLAYDLRQVLKNGTDAMFAIWDEWGPRVVARLVAFTTRAVAEFTQLRERAVGAFRELAALVVPPITALAENVRERLVSLRTQAIAEFTALRTMAVERFAALRERVTAIATELRTRAQAEVVSLRERAVNAFEQLRTQVLPKVVSLAQGVQERAVSLRTRAVQEFTTLRTMAAAQFTTLRERVTAIVSGIRERIVGPFGSIRERAVAEWVAMRDLALAAFRVLRETLAPLVQTIRTTVVTAFTALTSRVRGLWDTFVPQIVNGVQWVIDKVYDLSERFGIVGGDADTLGGKFGELIPSILAIINPIIRIITWASNLSSAWENDMLGIQTKTTEAIDEVKRIFNRVKLDWVKPGLDSIDEQFGTNFSSILNTSDTSLSELKTTTKERLNELVGEWFDRGQEIWNDLSDTFSNLRGDVDQILAFLVEDNRDRLQALVELFTSTATLVGNIVNDLFHGVVKPILQRMAMFWKDHGDQIKTIVGAFIGAVYLVVTRTLDLLISATQSAVNDLQRFWDDHGDQIMAIVTFAFDVIATTVGATLDAISTIINIALAAWNRDWTRVFELITGFTDRQTDRIMGIWERWGDKLLGWLGGKVDAIVGWFKELYNQIVGNSIIPDLMNDILSVVKNADIKGAFMGILNAAYNWIRGTAAPGLRGAVSDIIDAILRVIKAGDVKGAFYTIVNKAWKWLTGTAKRDLKSAGKGLVSAIVSGVKSRPKAVKKAVEGIVGNARDLLPWSDAEEGPFASLTESGRAIPETLAKGVLNKEGALRDAIADMVVRPDPSGLVDMARGRAGRRGAGGDSTHIEIHVEANSRSEGREAGKGVAKELRALGFNNQ